MKFKKLRKIIANTEPVSLVSVSDLEECYPHIKDVPSKLNKRKVIGMKTVNEITCGNLTFTKGIEIYLGNEK